MRRFALFLILSGSVWAAAGDITAAWVCGAHESGDPRMNGWVLDARMNATGSATFALGVATTFPSLPPYNPPTNAAVVLSLTSQGFTTAGASTNVSRTIIGTYYLRQAYPTETTPDTIAAGSADACTGDTVPAGYTDVRIALGPGIDPTSGVVGPGNVFAADTSISVNILAGAITVGGTTNNASILSVTNSASTSINSCSNLASYPAACSAASYPLPNCRWAGPVPYQQVTASTLAFEVVCSDDFFKQYKPVASVIISDGTTSYTVLNPTKSTSQANDQGAVQAYIANVDFTGYTPGTTQTFNFKACPWVGDTCLDSSVTTGPIVTATKNAGGALYAVGDTGAINGCSIAPMYKVLTLSTTAVATFAITYGGYGCSSATAATTTASGVQPGIPGTGFTVNTTVLRGVAGNESIGPIQELACYGSTSGKCAAPGAVVDPSGTSGAVAATVALAESAYNSGTHAGAYTTVQAAASACKTYNNSNNSHNDPGGCHVRLITGNHTLGSGSNLGAQTSWLVAEPFTGAFPNLQTCANSVLGISLVEINGVSADDTSSSCYFRGTATTDCLWVNSVPSSKFVTIGNVYSWLAGYLTGSTLTSTKVLSGLSTDHTAWALIRANVLPANTGCPLYAVFGNRECVPLAHDQSIVTAGAVDQNSQDISDGGLFAFNKTFSVNTGFPGWRGINGPTIVQYGAGFLLNVWEGVSPLTNAVASFFNDGTISAARNLQLWDQSIMGARTNHCYNDGTDTGDSTYVNRFTMSQWSDVGNLADSSYTKTDTFSAHPNGARTGNWSCTYWTGGIGNDWLGGAGYPSNANSWFGPWIGLYANYNPAQVTGTDSLSYVAIATHTASTAGNKPITCTGAPACWNVDWVQVGSALSDSNTLWTVGYVYQPPAFLLDAGQAMGTGLGNGNYRIYNTSSAFGLYPCSYQPLPYDIDGVPRVGRCSAGAYQYPAKTRRGNR